MNAPAPATRLGEAVFCTLDLETTGLHPGHGHRVCEVALVRGRLGEAPQMLSTLVDPGRPISPGATAVNGISDAMVKDAPRFREIVGRVLLFLRGAVVVAHNAPFDLAFLAAEFSTLDLDFSPQPVLCTLALARRHYRFPSNSLGAIARSLGMEVAGEHRALLDAQLTRSVFQRFLEDFQGQGVRTVGELLAFQGGSIPPPQPRTLVLPPLLEETLRRGSLLRLLYGYPGGGREWRLVSPLRVRASRGCLYLDAFCFLRGKERTFRLDRVLRLERGESHSSPPGPQ